MQFDGSIKSGITATGDVNGSWREVSKTATEQPEAGEVSWRLQVGVCSTVGVGRAWGNRPEFTGVLEERRCPRETRKVCLLLCFIFIVSLEEQAL